MVAFDFRYQGSLALFIRCLLVFKAIHEVRVVKILVGINLVSVVLASLQILNSPDKIADGLQLNCEDRLVDLT